MSNSDVLTAVVVGGGIAGVTAAAAALRHFDRVVLVDKDPLLGAAIASETVEETGRRRSGVAQYVQPHTLGSGGCDAMEAMLPGFKEQSKARGALVADSGECTRFFDFGELAVRGHIGMEAYCMSRRLVNEVLFDLLLRQGGDQLTVRDKTKVSGLLWEEGNAGVNGVVLASGEEIRGDMVFMADGRKSQVPGWLKEAGIKMPPSLRVDCRMNYAAAWARLPPDFDHDKEFYAAITFGRPSATRGGFALTVEDHLVQLSLYGVCDDRAPLDEAGWRAYAATFEDAFMAQLIDRCELVTPISRFAGVPNVMPQYHKAKLPQGLVVLGDAAMALNPVYGQGMSVAAVCNLELERCLAGAVKGKSSVAARRKALRAVGPRAQKRMHARADIAWQMATSEDSRYDNVEMVGVSAPPRLLRAYFDALFKAGSQDVRAWGTLLKVGQFVEPPSKLFTPHILGLAMRHMLGSMMGCGGTKTKGGAPPPPVKMATGQRDVESSGEMKDLEGGGAVKDVEGNGVGEVYHAVAVA